MIKTLRRLIITCFFISLPFKIFLSSGTKVQAIKRAVPASNLGHALLSHQQFPAENRLTITGQTDES